jgi:Protein of unknown function (DUF1648).
MNGFYKPAVGLMWAALLTSAWDYWHAWDRLPARMAVHFDANWQPNGYTSREGALMLGLGIMSFMLVIFTLTTLIVRALKPAAAWPILAVSYLVLSFCWYGNYSIVQFNLNAQPAHSKLVGSNPLAMSDSRESIQPHS